ncbi:hypothetical protein E2C01_074937 [Portunus trituberculatus]|uniref:Uncharacterized protein n=1 Tax=Portunus trituberculatus TaxID=210409 RepID=A0A5B7IEV3_PORTR|nr:hypothetical protein [Portunus trituberculatus]
MSYPYHALVVNIVEVFPDARLRVLALLIVEVPPHARTPSTQCQEAVGQSVGQGTQHHLSG